MNAHGVVRGVGHAVTLLGRATRGIAHEIVEPAPLVARRFNDGLATYLWRPLPVLIAIALLVGIVAGTVAARLLALYHAEIALVPPLARTLCRDVLPLVLGLFASGRISVDLAARLAATAVAREVEALEALGYDPARHLLAPALAGVLASVPVHLAVAAGFALAAAGWAVAASGQLGWIGYGRLVFDQATALALVVGMFKGLVFALTAFAVGAGVGTQPTRGPDDIAIRASSAFTIGVLAIFTLAALWIVLA